MKESKLVQKKNYTVESVPSFPMGGRGPWVARGQWEPEKKWETGGGHKEGRKEKSFAVRGIGHKKKH